MLLESLDQRGLGVTGRWASGVSVGLDSGHVDSVAHRHRRQHPLALVVRTGVIWSRLAASGVDDCFLVRPAKPLMVDNRATSNQRGLAPHRTRVGAQVAR